jgi:hypothetical protein
MKRFGEQKIFCKIVMTEDCYAALVGNNHHKDRNLQDLKYPENDADNLNEILLSNLSLHLSQITMLSDGSSLDNKDFY